jgi:hypothetical protein
MDQRMKSIIILGVLSFASSSLGPLAAADALRDPTRPPLIAASHPAISQEPIPILSAIIGKPGGRVAIFNGQLVRNGDAVGAYTIEAIFEDRVRYRHGSLNQEVYLPLAATFKKPSTAPARSPAGAE